MSQMHDFGSRLNSPLPFRTALSTTYTSAAAVTPVRADGNETTNQPETLKQKLALLSSSIQNLQQVCATVSTQNEILLQRLLDLERLTNMRCDCARLRAEVSEKNAQLKETRSQVAELSRRLAQAQNQCCAVPLCLRCGQEERQVVSLPCSHVGLCKACSRYATNCFLCGCPHQSTFDVSFRRLI